MNNTSEFLRLNWSDVSKGLLMAVLSPLLVYIAGLLGTPGFDLANMDWSYLVKMGLAAGISYLVKNFLSDKDGHVLGVIG